VLLLAARGPGQAALEHEHEALERELEAVGEVLAEHVEVLGGLRDVRPARRLLPDAPLYPLRGSMAGNNSWTANALIVDFDHNRGLRVNRAFAEQRARERPDLSAQFPCPHSS
jgi:hypothetical protein